ncbi:hypothetical protein ABT373_08205 [Streptomyces sp. NPDC000070]|uniref:4'-phosphopantetheinyl transferase family protein n=1 Tax=Streptomyces sp. NPDC000070 TaxID=3154240 RepID=UPI00331F4AA8
MSEDDAWGGGDRRPCPRGGTNDVRHNLPRDVPGPVRAGDELHVFQVEEAAEAGTELRRSRDGGWPLRRVLGRILGIRPDEVPLERDALGRLGLREGPFGLAVSGDTGRFTLALARGRRVALSVLEVPRTAGPEPWPAFGSRERRWAQAAPEGGRAERLARLWTRKEAALRLMGSPLSAAAELDASGTGERGGPVVLRRPAHGMWPAPPGAPDEAYVQDLCVGTGLAAAVATSGPAVRARMWRIDEGVAGWERLRESAPGCSCTMDSGEEVRFAADPAPLLSAVP